MPIPATALLVEFPLGGTAASAPKRAPERSVAPVEDPRESVEAAFARGREEGFAAGQKAMEVLLAEARAGFDLRIEEARTRWAAEEGDRLAERIRTAFTALETGIGDAVAGILTPFVEEAVRTRSVEALGEVLSPLLASGQHANFRVRGPRDLIDALKAKLGPSAAVFAFEVGDDVDVKVLADRTLIETQLEFWRSRIARRSV